VEVEVEEAESEGMPAATGAALIGREEVEVEVGDRRAQRVTGATACCLAVRLVVTDRALGISHLRFRTGRGTETGIWIGTGTGRG
jgi:hypothetical protein